MSTSLSSREVTPDPKELLARGEIHAARWEDDETALRSAAAQSRLPFDSMTAQELGCFPDMLDSRSSLNLFLFIRNKILQMWLLEPNVEVTVDDVKRQLPAPYDSDKLLLRRIHGFLNRYGYINFGCFYKMTGALPLKKKIIVIGAGAAGIAAAKQLGFFGFEVALLEARNRVGGRVQSHTFDDKTVDTGASIMTGICGNPLAVCLRQVQAQPYRMTRPTAMYYEEGKPVRADHAERLMDEFKKITDAAAYVIHRLRVDHLDGLPLNIADMYEGLFDLAELRVQRKRVDYWTLYEEVNQKIRTVTDQMLLYAKTAEVISEKVHGNNGVKKEEPADDREKLEREIEMRCYQKELEDVIRLYDKAAERLKELEVTRSGLRDYEPSDCHMNQRDKRPIDFCLAQLEFEVGAELHKVSAKHWDSQGDREMAGSQMGFKDSYADFLEHLCNKDVRKNLVLNATVSHIEYNKEGVKVTYQKDDTSVTETGDAVICTLPLGVMKMIVDPEAEHFSPPLLKSYTIPKFSPQLPDDYRNAVRSLACGHINKVIMQFERAFWDNAAPTFGHLSTSPESRGELYLFHAVPEQAILTAYMVGAAAEVAADDDMIVSRVNEVLVRIFGKSAIVPRVATITRWHREPLTVGATTYLPPGEDPSLFDTLSQPVRAPLRDKEGAPRGGPERIFFAGEHTNRKYPNCVQGAWLSGTREAARVADIFIGCPFARPKNGQADEVILSSDDEVEAKVPIVRKMSTSAPVVTIDS